MSEKTCANHGDALIWEDGGHDQATIFGRWYCPTCQELMMRALEAMEEDR